MKRGHCPKEGVLQASSSIVIAEVWGRRLTRAGTSASLIHQSVTVKCRKILDSFAFVICKL
jgi:hypothetical protein